MDRITMQKIAFVLIYCSGCGGVTHVSSDAAVDTSEAIDAAMPPPPPRCNRSSPFQTPVPLTSINTSASEEFGTLTPDERTIYFSSTRGGTLGGYDIFMATRMSRDAMFSNVTLVTGVNTAALERAPTVTADGLFLYALTGVGNHTL